MLESELIRTRNLGPASAKMLESVGITTLAQLRELGAVVAFVAVQRAGQKPSLNLLWALQGALQDVAWNAISEVEKAKLLKQVERLTASK